VSFGVSDVLVPFSGSYHPEAVGWGIVAMYLLLAVEATSLARKHLPKRVWRGIHMLSFPIFAFSTIHLLMVGTDRATPLMRYTVLFTVAGVLLATLIRIVQTERRDERRDGRGSQAVRPTVRPATAVDDARV